MDRKTAVASDDNNNNDDIINSRESNNIDDIIKFRESAVDAGVTSSVAELNDVFSNDTASKDDAEPIQETTTTQRGRKAGKKPAAAAKRGDHFIINSIRLSMLMLRCT